MLLPTIFNRDGPKAALAYLAKAVRISADDLFLDCRGEEMEAHDLFKARLGDPEPICELVQVLHAAIIEHGLDLVGEEELLSDGRLTEELVTASA